MSLSKLILSNLFNQSSKISLLLRKHLYGNKNNSKSKNKETPLCILLKASYTVEAAVTLPVFVCAVVAVLFFFRIFTVEMAVGSALNDTCRIIASYGDSAIDINKELKGQGELAAAMVMCNSKIILKDTPVKYIDGGILGINYLDSDVENNYIDLRAKYSLTFPLGIFGDHTIKVCQNSVSRKWIGWDPTEGNAAEGYVYITEYGTAYHKNIRCTYLNPSIKAIDYEQLQKRRNNSGAKYASCPLCKSKKISSGNVYITDYGDAYHSTIGCSGLKRTIYRILLEDAEGYQPCNKCVGE